MEDNFKIEQCSENDVLEFSSGAYRLEKVIEKIYEIFRSSLAKQLHDLLKSHNINIDPGIHNGNYGYYLWFDGGINCEILKVGAKDWQKGKVRLKVTLEFCPDEPEENIAKSPLDDIRQTI